MSDGKNPFSESVAGAERPSASRLGWVVAGIAGALAVLFLVFWYDALEKQHGLESLRGKLDDANASLNTALGENQKLKDQVEALQKQVFQFLIFTERGVEAGVGEIGRAHV